MTEFQTQFSEQGVFGCVGVLNAGRVLFICFNSEWIIQNRGKMTQSALGMAVQSVYIPELLIGLGCGVTSSEMEAASLCFRSCPPVSGKTRSPSILD